MNYIRINLSVLFLLQTVSVLGNIDSSLAIAQGQLDIYNYQKAKIEAQKIIDIKGDDDLTLLYKAKARNILGLVEAHESNFDKAFYYFNLNVDFYKGIDDKVFAAKSYLNISILFNPETDSYLEAIKYNKLSYRLFREVNFQEGIVNSYLNISAIYGSLITPQLDSVAYYLEKGLTLSQKENFTGLEAYFLGNLARLNFSNGNTKKAFELATESYNLFRNTLNDKNNEFVILKVFLNIYLKDKDYINAQKILFKRKVLSNQINNLSVKLYSTQDYIYFFKEQEQFDSAFHYSQQYKRINDSLHNLNIEKGLRDIEEKYQSEKKEIEITLLKETQKSTNNFQYLLLTSLLLLIITFSFITYFLYKRKQRNEQRIKELKLNEELKTSKIEKIEAENLARTEKNGRLKNELEFKNQELNLLAISTIDKNNEVKESIEILKIITSQIQNSKLNKAILNLEKNVSTDKDWAFFKIHFERTFPNYIQHIKKEHPSLTTKDIQIIAYTKTNLKNKDIATIFGISAKSIQVSKFRLKKKLDLNAEDNLNDYILHF